MKNDIYYKLNNMEVIKQLYYINNNDDNNDFLIIGYNDINYKINLNNIEVIDSCTSEIIINKLINSNNNIYKNTFCLKLIVKILSFYLKNNYTFKIFNECTFYNIAQQGYDFFSRFINKKFLDISNGIELPLILKSIDMCKEYKEKEIKYTFNCITNNRLRLNYEIEYTLNF